MIQSTPGMSRPLAATSVHISKPELIPAYVASAFSRIAYTDWQGTFYFILFSFPILQFSGMETKQINFKVNWGEPSSPFQRREAGRQVGQNDLLHFPMERNSWNIWQNLQLRKHCAPIINTCACHEVSVARSPQYRQYSTTFVLISISKQNPAVAQSCRLSWQNSA